MSSPLPPFLVAGQFLGAHRLIRPIGQGAAGAVWEAEDLTLRRRVALKTLHPQMTADPAHLRRFGREARLMALLQGQGAPDVFTLAEDQGLHFFAMTLLAGDTANTLLQKNTALSFRQLAPLLEQLLGVLSTLHRLGVAHRDIKPDHLLLSRRAGGPRLWLVDFGLAKTMTGEDPLSLPGEVAAAPGLTQFGKTLGTPGYIAPELLAQHPLSPASDLFGVGVSAVELLMGQRWLSAKTRPQRQALYARGFDEELAHLPLKPAEKQWLLSLLQTSPQDRPQNAQEALEGLQLLQHATTTNTPIPAPALSVSNSAPQAPGYYTAMLGRFGLVALSAALWWMTGQITRAPMALPKAASAHRVVWLSKPTRLLPGDSLRYTGPVRAVAQTPQGWEFEAGGVRLRWQSPRLRLTEGDTVRLTGRVNHLDGNVAVLKENGVALKVLGR